MARRGINAVLFDKVVRNPPAWLGKLGLNLEKKQIHYLPSIKKQVDGFLSATTDPVRLVAASEVSRKVLDQHEMGELEELREKIQLSELLRSIPYGRQTDHSAHTLYLFLLGLLFLYHDQRFEDALAADMKEDPRADTFVDRMYLRWTFASLLHDVGYIFQSDAVQQRIVDRMFRPSTIMRQLTLDTDEIRRAARQKVVERAQRTDFAGAPTPEDLLDRLRHQPWAKDAGLYADAFDTFCYEGKFRGIDSGKLEEFAYLVAANGYDGKSAGAIDHAVASGLFLLSYSTFWWWLAKEIGFTGTFGTYPQSYNKGDVVAGCYAVAAHNVIGIYGEQYGKLKFDDNTLLYLAILCDELQKWDRFPAGESHLTDLKSFADFCTDSEHLDVDTTKTPFVFTFHSPKLAASVRKGLDRLDGWNAYVEVRP